MCEKNDSFESKHIVMFDEEGLDPDNKGLYGGKGANLIKMTQMGIPVPLGFVVTTEACRYFMETGDFPEGFEDDLKEMVAMLEQKTGRIFGDVDNPLIVSVRSGAPISMPGMMDTVLNIGMNVNVANGWGKVIGNSRLAWDSFRRLLQMFGDVVLGIKSADEKDDDPFDVILDEVITREGVENDRQLNAGALENIADRFSALISERGFVFPDDPWEQLKTAIKAVFRSWNTERAVFYRRGKGIPETMGTAVNVQLMVFGNMNSKSATGVVFTRDSATGKNTFNGEYLLEAQGEDVVAGVRTPLKVRKTGSLAWAKLSGISEEERLDKFLSFEEVMPEIYSQLFDIQHKLEEDARDMQDIEFTVEDGKLWILQTRDGMRTAGAMIKITTDFLSRGEISEDEFLRRIDADKISEVLHPVFDPKVLNTKKSFVGGLPASPGAGVGQIVFTAGDAEKWVAGGKKVVLVRTKTSPEDVKGMKVSEAILTAEGGATSHAAVVARGWGKCCVVAASEMKIDYSAKTVMVDGKIYKEGDWISVNGSTGKIYEGKIPVIDPELTDNFYRLIEICKRRARMEVRANADTPEDAKKACGFEASGIGLCRTEHMFFEKGRLEIMREMIMANNDQERSIALEKLLSFQRSDFEGIFTAMNDLPVTVRLLDPPLHEFLPDKDKLKEKMSGLKGSMSYIVGSSDRDDLFDIEEKMQEVSKVLEVLERLSEENPMMGHRGCRLGITFPAIIEMQVRAMIEAALNAQEKGVVVKLEIMVPLIGVLEEFVFLKKIILEVAEEIFSERGKRLDFLIGTMIEIPAAALAMKKIAKEVDFISFGTNDLTQMGLGISRDDGVKFIRDYLEKGIYKHNPFEVLDQEYIGVFVKIAVDDADDDIKKGICGEHGGNPISIKFFHEVGLDYVSCSPLRIPVAWVAAAKATLD